MTSEIREHCHNDWFLVETGSNPNFSVGLLIKAFVRQINSPAANCVLYFYCRNLARWDMARQVDSGYQGRVEIFQTKGTEHLFGLNEFEKVSFSPKRLFYGLSLYYQWAQFRIKVVSLFLDFFRLFFVCVYIHEIVALNLVDKIEWKRSSIKVTLCFSWRLCLWIGFCEFHLGWGGCGGMSQFELVVYLEAFSHRIPTEVLVSGWWSIYSSSC